MGGETLAVTGETVVLAAGALETARILLASDGQVAGGIGNAHDLVGRFYTDHLKHHSGILVPGPTIGRFATELQYAPKPRFCVCFALDDETQRREELLEHVVYLKPIYRKGLRGVLGRLVPGQSIRDENGVLAAYRVKFVSEQVPHEDCRVTLADGVDALGVPKAQLDWRFTELDRRSLPRTVELLQQRFDRAGMGSFEFGPEPPSIDTMTDAAHQMGTTRMARRPEEGVVDPDCRVFGVDNLYVSSSAVFPTGPSYSPTFTILALARRLGHHLLATRERQHAPATRYRSA